ncbi:hypothetical protein CPB83DRAFT_775875 [Crepidotus variabilis]|uniref:DUF3533 domain-containing protein n=1 Tax=Crepidotus variabilis TaxID=179855 RepID=A0A9P6JJR0_9AGAR|nr:hypothetical protein CPB83DRAFT_775875 [Crepidotus variabilis]
MAERRLPEDPSSSRTTLESKPSYDTQLKQAYQTYAKVLGLGCLAVIIMIFAIFSIYWGSLEVIPARNIQGWLIDFDGGSIGQIVTQGLTSSPNPASKITWNILPPSQFSSLDAVRHEVYDEKTFVALTINPGASSRLQASLSSPNATYNGSEAISIFASEARSENAFRSLIRPSIQASLDPLLTMAAARMAKEAASNPNLMNLLTTSPQTLTLPVWYQLININPFDQTLATAVTFVGLIYQVILAFFVVNMALGARQASGLERLLPMRKLVMLRLGSSFLAYLIISLFYCLLSLAFQLKLHKTFGSAGFLVFWMLNFVGILALGLALESMMTLLTIKFVAFFMLIWIIGNVSVVAFPLELMPVVYRYGYAAPFYNLTKAMRTILFDTKNEVGYHFGILFVWVAISCITLPIFMILTRKRDGSQAKTQEQNQVRNQDSNPEPQWLENEKLKEPQSV